METRLADAKPSGGGVPAWRRFDFVGAGGARYAWEHVEDTLRVLAAAGSEVGGGVRVLRIGPGVELSKSGGALHPELRMDGKALEATLPSARLNPDVPCRIVDVDPDRGKHRAYMLPVRRVVVRFSIDRQHLQPAAAGEGSGEVQQ